MEVYNKLIESIYSHQYMCTKLFFCCLLLSFFSIEVFAQKSNKENGKLGGVLPLDSSGVVSYQVVEQVIGVDKKELYQRARTWFVNTYKSANNVLQINDAELGELSGRGILTVPGAISGAVIPIHVEHAVLIEVKDERYRATVNGFSVVPQYGVGGSIDNIKNATKKFVRNVYLRTDEQVTSMLASLNKAMNTKKSDF